MSRESIPEFIGFRTRGYHTRNLQLNFMCGSARHIAISYWDWAEVSVWFGGSQEVPGARQCHHSECKRPPPQLCSLVAVLLSMTEFAMFMSDLTIYIFWEVLKGERGGCLFQNGLEGPRKDWEKVQVLWICRGVGVFSSRVIRDEYKI